MVETRLAYLQPDIIIMYVACYREVVSHITDTF